MARQGGKIRGITIEIGGDTTKLQNSLKQVDSALSNTQGALKDINKLLKLNPGNTELLVQKQENLKKSIEETKERLRILNDAYKELGKEGTPEAKAQQEALKREIIDTEGKLKSLKKEYQDFGSVAKQQLKAAGDAMKDVGDKMQNIGKDLSMKLTAPILAVGTLGVTYNAELEQLQALFTTLTGSAEEADRVISQIQADASKSPFDVQTLIKANQYLISAGVSADDARQTILDLGNAIAATGGGNDELDRMAMNLQQIQNVGKASSVDIKQFANAGINIYGLLADSMGVSVEKAKDMDVTYEQLAEALSKASSEGGKYYGAMEAQSETLNGSVNKLKSSVKALLGAITKSAMPIIQKVIAKIQDVVDWFSNLDESQQETILKIAAAVAAIGPALVIAGKVISVLGTVVSAIGAVVGVLGGPLTVAIAAAIAAGVAIYKNWNTIAETGKMLWQRTKDNWTGIKNAVVDAATSLYNGAKEKFQAITDFITRQVDKLKNLFDFKWELPKIELPHFFNSGNTGPLGLPKIEVEWYSKAMKNGMILDQPTIFGTSNGKLLGAGEAGAEVIIGANSLYDMIRNASQGTVVNMTVNGGNVSANELADIVMDKLTTTIRRNNQRW